MKHMKKLLSLALVFALVLALAVPAFAEDGDLPALPTGEEIGLGEKTPVDVTNHKFEAYQIFKAEAGANPTEDTEYLVTSSIDWGDGLANPEDFYAKLQEAFPGKFTAEYDTDNPKNTAIAAAEVIAVMADKGDEAYALAKFVDEYAGKINPIPAGGTMPAGYYLVVDITEDVEGEANVKNLSFLAFSTNTTFTPESKIDVPQVGKSVYEKNDSETGSDGWKDHADYDIGDDVPFTLTGTLPSNYDKYKTYKYAFHDTTSDGLDINENSVTVYVDGTKVETGYEAKVSTDKHTLDVTFANLKDYTQVTSTSIIQVQYTAKLTDAAVIGNAGNGNWNEVYLEFSNNPNHGGEGDTGTTPPEKVIVFTFELDVNKVKEDGSALEGAGFTLSKLNAETGEYEVVKTLDVEEGKTEFKFEGLDAGIYMLEETTVPSGYNKADNIYFKITANYDDATKTETLIVTILDAEGNAVETTEDGQVIDLKVTEVDGENKVENTGILETNVVNLQGLRLPSTGGIGTTIFYVVGGILLVGAAVLLITKKRMGAAE